MLTVFSATVITEGQTKVMSQIVIDLKYYTVQSIKTRRKVLELQVPVTFDSVDTSSAEKSSSTLVRKFNYLSSN